MSDSGQGNGTNRDELMQRLELMEKMIAEGRRFTTRCGWIFLLWGLVSLTAMGWRFFMPHSHGVGMWAWPVCLIAGAVLTCIGLALQRRNRGRGLAMNCLNVDKVWFMTGVGLACYIASAMVSHRSWQISYIAGLLIIVGLAHAISAAILRWGVQGAMAGIWWLGGIAVFRARSQGDIEAIMFVEMCVSMIAFGIYAMVQERRHGRWVRNV